MYIVESLYICWQKFQTSVRFDLISLSNSIYFSAKNPHVWGLMVVIYRYNLDDQMNNLSRDLVWAESQLKAARESKDLFVDVGNILYI